MCDVYMGCNQEYSFTTDVLAGHGSDSEESMNEEYINYFINHCMLHNWTYYACIYFIVLL